MVPNAEVIAQIEWMLDRAQSGEIQGFAGAVTYADRTASKMASGYQNDAMIGALTRLMHTMIDGMK